MYESHKHLIQDSIIKSECCKEQENRKETLPLFPMRWEDSFYAAIGCYILSFMKK